MTNGAGQAGCACCGRVAPRQRRGASPTEPARAQQPPGQEPARPGVSTLVQPQSTKPGLLAHPTLLQGAAASHCRLSHPLSVSPVCYGLTAPSTTPQSAPSIPPVLQPQQQSLPHPGLSQTHLPYKDTICHHPNSQPCPFLWVP